MPTASYDAILKELKQKSYRPVYFLTGEEPYFIDKLTDYIADNVLTESERSFNQIVLYGKETTVEDIVSQARRYPMMSAYQVVLVKEAQELKKLERLEAYLKSPVETTILVLNYKHKKLAKTTKLYKLFDKQATVMESPKVYDNKLPGWINGYIKEKGVQIEPQATQMLADYIGTNLTKLSNEIDKIILSLGRDNNKITPTSVSDNIGISKDFNIFELQTALAKRDAAKLFRIITHMQGNPKANPMPMIVGTLYGYFSKLYILERNARRPDFNPQSAGIPHFKLNEYKAAAAAYKGRTHRAVKLLLEYDLRFKGVNNVGTPEGELLEELCFRLIKL